MRVRLTLESTGILPIAQFETFANGQINLASNDFDFTQLTDFTDSSLNMAGINVDLPSIRNISNSTLTVNGGLLELNNVDPVNIDGASFFIDGNTTLAIPTATNYTYTNGTVNDNGTFRVTGSGSKLDLSNLVTISHGTDIHDQLTIEALNGGVIDLSSVTDIVDPAAGASDGRATHISAQSSGLVNLSSLQNFIDSHPQSHHTEGLSSMMVETSGEIRVSSLTSLNAVRLTLESTGILPIAQFETFANGQINLASNDFDFTQLTDFTDSSLNMAGINVDLPSIRNISNSTLTVNGGLLELNNVDPVNIDGASFFIDGNTTLAIPTATNYTYTNGTVNDNGTFRRDRFG